MKHILISVCCIYSFSFAQEISKIKNIPLPAGCSRIQYPEQTFSRYLQELQIKDNKEIIAYSGDEIENSIYNVLAVVNAPCLFKSDIEQCADWCMRFWADYHNENNKLNNLFLYEYSGKKKPYQNGISYKKFLSQSFSFSNSYSLKKGCKEIQIADLKPGDMFVQNTTGGIGHVSMIVDACVDSKGIKYYLIGFSFMPAQQFHIEDASDKYGKGAWFTATGYIEYLSNYFNFGEPVLRRFE